MCLAISALGSLSSMFSLHSGRIPVSVLMLLWGFSSSLVLLDVLLRNGVNLFS